MRVGMTEQRPCDPKCRAFLRNESDGERDGSAVDEVDKISTGPTCTRILDRDAAAPELCPRVLKKIPAIMISRISATMWDVSLYSMYRR